VAETVGLLLEQSGSTRLTWADQGVAYVYDVAGGSLSTLRSSAGVSDGQCLEDDLLAPTWEDTRLDPQVGDAYYYLVRPQDSCGPGTYGSISSGDERELADDCGEWDQP